jgi:hypothetical protein
MTRRRRGSADEDVQRLRQIYDDACRNRRRNPPQDLDLYAATGADPLLETDPDRATKVYGVADATRPTVQIRRIKDEVWGDALTAFADSARELQRRHHYKNAQAAAETVAACAKNGFFLGVHAPVSFDDAVKRLRKALGEPRRDASHRAGWTGEWLRVRPADGLTVRDPENLPVPLAPDGATVPDSLYWRSRIRDGDVVLIENWPTGNI